MLCSRCKEEKNQDDFWFNSSRGKIDQPCKDCRNHAKRLKRKNDFINIRLTPSELDSSYRLKGFPDDIREVLINKITLNRTINIVSEPHLISNSEMIILYCPICGFTSKLNAPAPLEGILNMHNLYLLNHGNTCKKQTIDKH